MCIYSPNEKVHWYRHRLRNNGLVFFFIPREHGNRRGSIWIREHNNSGEDKFDVQNIIRSAKMNAFTFSRLLRLNHVKNAIDGLASFPISFMTKSPI